MAQPAQSTSPYFVNGPVDFLFVGGASIVAFVLMSLFYTDQRTPEVISLGVFLMWVINWPHFSMSTYRLYQSKSHLRQFPFTAYVIPWIVLGGVVLSFAYPEQIAPYFVKLFLLWSPYHFSGQTIGITMIYARRCGVTLGTWERRALNAFVYGTFLLSSIRAEVSREGYDYYGVHYPTFGVPEWAVTLTEYWFWAAAVIFAGLVVAWCIRHKRVMPVIVILPAITQYIWFVQSIYMPSFQEFVPMFHSLQYILIAWSIQLKIKLDTKRLQPSKRFVIAETSRWGVINLAGGAALFYMLPTIGASAGYPPLFAEGVIIAAVQIHHFFVDGVIWKLRHESVSHPLMMRLRDVAGGPKEPERISV